MEKNAQSVHSFFVLHGLCIFDRGLDVHPSGIQAVGEASCKVTTLAEFDPFWMHKIDWTNCVEISWKEGKFRCCAPTALAATVMSAECRIDGRFALWNCNQLLNVRTRLDEARQPLSDKVAWVKFGCYLMCQWSHLLKLVIDQANNYILQLVSLVAYRTWFMVSCWMIRDALSLTVMLRPTRMLTGKFWSAKLNPWDTEMLNYLLGFTVNLFPPPNLTSQWIVLPAFKCLKRCLSCLLKHLELQYLFTCH